MTRLYSTLAAWWPLLSAPEEYAEEAEVYATLLEQGPGPVEDVLELGSGGGNNASHLKHRFRMTLTDVSAEMLEVSRRLNPECEHVTGDMRTLRLGRTFDAVFVHDAICYMTTEADLAAALATIAAHCSPGGRFVIAADEVSETFAPSTSHGGHDGGGRSLRYLEWSHGPAAGSTRYEVDYVLVMRTGEDVTVEHDRHVNGLFPRATWLGLMNEAGLDPRSAPHTFSDGSSCEVFTGVRRP
ncbi:MAG TPA: class I SAM-dependent methyltransferase [Actinomycetota bacterium]|nr:class I SAM-dependent methyltransferase [Actinomycetota bacterium]